jgi:two-component system response regulator AtoC
VSRVLLVDDEPGVRFTLSEVITDQGHEVIAVESGRAALERIDDVDAVVTDLSMPEMDGLELLSAIRRARPELPVVILTAHGSERAAVKAMKEGAHDYLTKPFDVDELALVVDRALDLVNLRHRARRADLEATLGRRFIADHPTMRRLLETVTRVASRDVPVLVVGETGTGKEFVSTLLHAESRRSAGPLIRVNCAAVPKDLAEAELFGHARGAFTGAHQARQGYFQRAHEGTLVLDEAAELPLEIQAKLLRALQSGEVQAVGAPRIETVDVRVVASTHRDLAAEVEAGRFREDLYYRLAVVVVRVPALRERRSDIGPLARALSDTHARRLEMSVTLSDALVAALEARSWPGNVRELENAILTMIALSDGGTLGTEALDLVGTAPSPTASAAGGGSLRKRLDALERTLIAEALDAAGGNQSEAARRLELSRPTLIARAKRFGLI